jgi:serine protease inhibitor ecotin
MEMNDLRDKIRKYETNSDGIDQQVIRLKVQLEEEQGETERVTNINCDYQRNIDRLKTELAASHLKNRKLDAELSEREIETTKLEKE